MGVSILVVYLGGYLYLVFFALCLASGLYYLAELIEENIRTARRLIGYAIKGIIGIHFALLLFDRFSISCLLIGALCHALYLRLLRTFPYISLTSIDFLSCVGMLCLSHVLWIHHFLYGNYKHRIGNHITIEWLFGFFLVMLWIIPFFFFLSLASSESILPSSMPSRHTDFHPSDAIGSSTSRKKRNRSSLLGLFNFLRSKRDEILPEFMSKLPSSLSTPRSEKAL